MKQVQMQLDPTDHYSNEGAPLSYMVEACGLIPSFIDPESDDLLIDDLINGYGFPTSDMAGLVVDKVYTNQHARDEDLYPYMEIVSGSETIYIYPYGIVASVYDEDGEQTQLITRLD